MMVSPEKGIRPRGSAAERRIFVDHRALEHRLLIARGGEAFVSAGPDAFFVENFTLPVFGSTTRAVALILGALGFRAQVCDVGQRAVTTIVAAVQRELPRLLKGVCERSNLARRAVKAFV